VAESIGEKGGVTGKPEGLVVPTPSEIFIDTFCHDQRAGSFPLTAGVGVSERRLLDAERRVSADRGALRFEPLRLAGWTRQGVVYGPLDRQSGLAFGATILNGHNGSHSGPIDGGLRRRFTDWALGPRDRNITMRAVEFARSRRKRESWWLWRQWLSRWWLSRSDDSRIEHNLVIGFFDRVSPTRPLQQGLCLAVRTNGAETATVTAVVRGGEVTVLPVLFNVPTSYMAVTGPFGATYFGASIPGVAGLPSLPSMRPLALDRRPQQPDSQVAGVTYAGIHQSVLGQVGFSADTRIFETAASMVPEWSQWWTTAHVADALMLDGNGPIEGSTVEHGSWSWTIAPGSSLNRTPVGLVTDADGMAYVEADEPVGLAAVSVVVAGEDGQVGLVFRMQDERNHFLLEANSDGAGIVAVIDGVRQVLATNPSIGLEPGRDHLLQVSDDGQTILAHVDNQPVSTLGVSDRRLADASGLGVRLQDAGSRARHLEAHPRSVDPELRSGLVHLPVPVGDTVRIRDDFDYPPGDLDGRSPGPGLSWSRVAGKGIIEVGDHNRTAEVRANAQSPNPERTLYLLPWSGIGDPGPNASAVADLEVDITPPGTARNQGQRGRAGIVFWQDPDHYIIVSNWLDDVYPGASLSLFSRLGPFEDVFRAVWSNVGQRIDWGVTHRLRVSFDGATIAAWIDGETVLYRTISDVHADTDAIVVNAVGLVANWEWGNDTGSTFARFVARTTSS
jgi:hypothetical protein